MKKTALIIVILSIATGIFLGVFTNNKDLSALVGSFKLRKPDSITQEEITSEKKETSKPKEEISELADRDVINILLLGIDRRSKSATAYNTDTMILLSANPKDNVVLLTSVPRDIWINGNKINALYSTQGEDSLTNAFEKITGLSINGYIRCDFEDFRWIVNSFGGVPVDVERSFKDVHFPNNTDTGLKPVSFEAGFEVMDGWRALDFARSRKGTNGEGSDLMRAKRQHRILMGMVDGISQPQSNFWPMDIPKFYEAVTQRMHTTLSLTDVRYLWDFYKDRDDYETISFVVDDEYIYHPGMYPNSEYHAWVFIPRDSNWSDLHSDIQEMLFPQEIEEENLETN
jgi:LCP family protein required for cell wall assembly